MPPPSTGPLALAPIITTPIFRTFLGGFNLQKLPSRRLQTLWEQKNRVLLEDSRHSGTRAVFAAQSRVVSCHAFVERWCAVVSVVDIRALCFELNTKSCSHGSSGYCCYGAFLLLIRLYGRYRFRICLTWRSWRASAIRESLGPLSASGVLWGGTVLGTLSGAVDHSHAPRVLSTAT